MKIKNMITATGLATLLGTASLSAFATSDAISGNVRVVIGSSSTGGDTYQAASMISEALSDNLDVNFKVDAVGVSAAFSTLDRSRNSSTIMIFHDHAYLGKLYNQRGFKDIFEKYVVGPTFAINPGNAFLVAKDSPYQTLQDVIDVAGQGTDIKVAIQPGGVSEIGYSALKNAIKIQHPGMEDHLIAFNTGSQSDKNQTMFDGLTDLISGSVQANEQYTRLPADDQKAMRFVWLTARGNVVEQANPEGIGETSREMLMQYVEPNVTVPMDETSNFNFDKEFFFIYNKATDPKVIAALDQALEEIYAEGNIQKEMKKSFFIPNYLPTKQSQTYLKHKNDQYEKVINAIKN